MEVRTSQVTDIPAATEAREPAPSAWLPRPAQWRVQATGVLAVAVSLAIGLALVPPFAADLARQGAVAAADAAYLDDAEMLLLRAIAWTPQNAYLHQFLGEIYYRKALFRPQQQQTYLDAALAAFERSARLNPQEAETYVLMGWVHLYRGDAPAAEAAVMKAKVLDPNNPYVRYSLGTAYLWQKKLTQARAEMEFARRYFPNAGEIGIALQEIDRLERGRSP